MLSSYLTQLEQEYHAHEQAEIEQTVLAYDSRCKDLRRTVPQTRSFGSSLLLGSITGLLITAVIATFIPTLSLIVLAVAIAVCTLFFMGSDSSSADQQVSANQKEASALEAQKQQELTAIHRRYADGFEAQKLDYLHKVNAARTKFGSTKSARRITLWLADRFEQDIRSADRRSQKPQIRAEFVFCVQADQVLTLVQYGSEYQAKESFDFASNGLTPLQVFANQSGLAEALSRLLQVEILRRFPADPVSPCGASPAIMISADDNLMEMTYQVINPNCQ